MAARPEDPRGRRDLAEADADRVVELTLSSIRTLISADGESALYVADVVDYDAGTPKLANKQEIIRARQPDCTIEAQDFRSR